MSETARAVNDLAVPVVGPVDHPVILYRALDQDRALVYVGQTSDLMGRLSDHRRTDWWSRVAVVETEGFDDRSTAMAAELLAIEAEAPQENVRPGYLPVTARPVASEEYGELLGLLLPTVERSGEPLADLTEAARRAVPRLRDLERQLGLVIADLHARGRSWREIEATTGIPYGTARRWAEVAR